MDQPGGDIWSIKPRKRKPYIRRASKKQYNRVVSFLRMTMSWKFRIQLNKKRMCDRPWGLVMVHRVHPKKPWWFVCIWPMKNMNSNYSPIKGSDLTAQRPSVSKSAPGGYEWFNWLKFTITDEYQSIIVSAVVLHWNYWVIYEYSCKLISNPSNTPLSYLTFEDQ